MYPGVQAEPFGVMPSTKRLKRPRVLVVLLAVTLAAAGAVYGLRATLWAAKSVGATADARRRARVRHDRGCRGEASDAPGHVGLKDFVRRGNLYEAAVVMGA